MHVCSSNDYSGWSQRQEPERNWIQVSPCDWQGPQDLSHHPLCLRVCINEKLESGVGATCIKLGHWCERDTFTVRLKPCSKLLGTSKAKNHWTTILNPVKMSSRSEEEMKTSPDEAELMICNQHIHHQRRVKGISLKRRGGDRRRAFGISERKRECSKLWCTGGIHSKLVSGAWLGSNSWGTGWNV